MFIENKFNYYAFEKDMRSKAMYSILIILIETGSL